MSRFAIRYSGWPGCTNSPARAYVASTVPANGAAITALARSGLGDLRDARVARTRRPASRSAAARARPRSARRARDSPAPPGRAAAPSPPVRRTAAACARTRGRRYSRCTASTPICRSASATRDAHRRALRADLLAVERELRRVDHAERRPGATCCPSVGREPQERAAASRRDDRLRRLEVPIGVGLHRRVRSHERDERDRRATRSRVRLRWSSHQRTCRPRVVR